MESLLDELSADIQKCRKLKLKYDSLDNKEYGWEQLQDEVKERSLKEQKQSKSLDYKADCEYAIFCAWCNGYKDFEYTETNFKEYTTKIKRNLDFWVRKRIAEKYFNYEFKFDYNKNKWESKKISEV